MVFLLVILIAAIGLVVDSLISRHSTITKKPGFHDRYSNNQKIIEAHLHSISSQKKQSAVLI